MWETAGEVRTNSLETFSYGLPYKNEQVLVDQLEFINNTSMWTQDVA